MVLQQEQRHAPRESVAARQVLAARKNNWDVVNNLKILKLFNGDQEVSDEFSTAGEVAAGDGRVAVCMQKKMLEVVAEEKCLGG